MRVPSRCKLLTAVVITSLTIVSTLSPTMAGKPKPPPPPPVVYRIQWLGSLGGTKTYVRDINADGQAVGWSAGPDGRMYAFLWTPSDGMVALETLIDGWRLTDATGINDLGQIIGYGYTLSPFKPAGFVYTPGYTDSDGTWIPPVCELIPPLAGDSLAYPGGINNHGEVCAESQSTNPTPSYREMVYRPGYGSVDLGASNGSDNLFSEINDNGQVVGTHIVGATYYTYVYDPTSGLHLYNLIPNRTGYFGSWGVAINNAGTFVGGCNDPNSRSTGLFPYKDSAAGGVKLLTTTVGGQAYGINNNGHVVGTGSGDGFLYTDSIGFWNLDDLIDRNDSQRSLWLSAWNVVAKKVADAPGSGGFGQICGTSTFNDGTGNYITTSWILTPESSGP